MSHSAIFTHTVKLGFPITNETESATNIYCYHSSWKDMYKSRY